MKVYISADIEGVTGVTSWKETILGEEEHKKAAWQMTREVVSACEAALACGAEQIYVKDAHDSARNINGDELPDQVTLIRGWTCTPESMMAGIDESFDAVIFIGYHSGAGFDGNPLAHTMNGGNNFVKINERTAAEFDMNAYVAAHYGVPVVFISGDEQLCSHAKELVPEIETCGVKWGWGEATFNMNPDAACREIRAGAEKGLKKLQACRIQMPEQFEVEINYKEFANALRASYYPKAVRLDGHTVKYTAADIQEMMTARMFML